MLWAFVTQVSFHVTVVNTTGSSATETHECGWADCGQVTGVVPGNTFLSSCGVETSSSNRALSSNKISSGTQTYKTDASRAAR